MLKDQFFDFSDRLRINAFVARQSYRLQPEFAFTIRCRNMDVRWFVTFVGVKMKPEGTNS
jgi:hypothetical protein